VSRAIFYFLWPYRPIRCPEQLVGAFFNVLLQIIMAMSRWRDGLGTMDSFGLLRESFWFISGLVMLGWQMGLIHGFLTTVAVENSQPEQAGI
jgi:hypothetical protein